MLFSSITFLYLFLPITMILYYLVPFRLKNHVLLIASVIFYASGVPKYLILLLISAFVGWLHGLGFGKHPRSKAILVSGLIWNLVFLLFFKYADFLIGTVNGAIGQFIGTGEKLDMIEAFHPERMASRILGMGDVLSLIEKAEQALDQKKAAELEQRLRANKFTLADFYDQLLQLKKMGSMQELMAMMPGMGSMKNMQVDESAMGRVEAIILSMTPYERENPGVLNSSRKRRIALGCGQKVEDINRLLKQFEQMQQLIKQLNGKGGKKNKLLAKMGGMKGFPGM